MGVEDNLPDRFDIVVVGGGPAGMGAATISASIGLTAALIDDQPNLGGQIYRNIAHSPAELRSALGPTYRAGREQVEQFLKSGVWHIDCASVWDIDSDQRLLISRQGRSFSVQAKKIIVATGAMERPVPIPGWTLPGVFTVGALQTALKGSGTAPQGRLALVGSGPLLLQLLCQYLKLGIRPTAIVSTTPSGSFKDAIAKLPAAIGVPSQLLQGVKLLSALRRSRIPFHRNVRNLGVLGSGFVEGLSFETDLGAVELALDIVALHEDVVPNPQLARLVGAEHKWNAERSCFEPRLDPWGRSSVENVLITGDAGGIEGALAASARGVLAASAAAFDLGHIDRDQRGAFAADAMALRKRHASARPFLDRLFPPPEIDHLLMQINTIICRCENVNAGQINTALADGATGPNQVKAFTRCVWGPAREECVD